MDKTMTRFLAILAVLTCAASAQTYRTVTADTNNVIRTNFSLGRAQVSDLDGASFAISNITGLQTALDGKLATNGDAFALTNFPAELLRTNGDGSGLTNLPNANLTNATGILPIVSGGTGQTNAEAAIEALLPAYTNNADKILALNSNATGLVWTTNAGGGGGGSGVTTNIVVQTITVAGEFVVYTNLTDFTNAITGTNATFDDILTNVSTAILNGPITRTNSGNSISYSMNTDSTFVYVEAVGSETWVADGNATASNFIFSTTNTNVYGLGGLIFQTDASFVVKTNATFTVVVNSNEFTNTFIPTTSNSFWGVTHTNPITNVRITTSTNNRYITTRRVVLSTKPNLNETNLSELTISNGSVVSITNP